MIGSQMHCFLFAARMNFTEDIAIGPETWWEENCDPRKLCSSVLGIDSS